MGCFTAGYYDQVKDYLHPQLHDFVHDYRQEDIYRYIMAATKKIKMEPGS